MSFFDFEERDDNLTPRPQEIRQEYRLWQADPPKAPPITPNVDSFNSPTGDGENGAWGLTGLVVGLFIVVLLLLALVS